MRVAVVVNCLKLGGMERAAVNLAEAFEADQHESHLILLKKRKQEIEVSPKVNLHLFNLKKMVLFSGIGCLWFILSKIMNIAFRKTFPHFFAYAEAMAFRYKLKQLEKQFGRFDLVVFRGQGTFGQIWPMKDERFVFVCESIQNKTLYGVQSKWIFNGLFAHRNMVCVSKGAKESFDDLIATHDIPCRSVRTISNPNDFMQIKQKADQTLSESVSHSKPFILGLGRLVPLKNFQLLIQAYAITREKYQITHDLVIVGSGPERENLEAEVAKLDLQDCVFFKGMQENPFPWYKCADLFVLSSQSEGLGMVLIEALACGTKVVATDCPGGVRDIMSGELTHFLCEQNAESMAEKMIQALSFQSTDLYQKEVAQIMSRFDQETIVNQYIDTFLLHKG